MFRRSACLRYATAPERPRVEQGAHFLRFAFDILCGGTVEPRASGEGATSFPLPLSTFGVEAFTAAITGAEEVKLLFGLDASVFGSSQWLVCFLNILPFS